MIYNGTTTDQTGETTQIGGSKFNNLTNDNMYVGFQYTSGEVHGRGTNSTIKGVLDSWYSSNLNSYASKIATGEGATFCNDRTLYSGTGIETSDTNYSSVRFWNYETPTFKCADIGDRFATSVGLITADEVAYAGGAASISNSEYYLHNDNYYWTMTACYFSFNDLIASVFDVGSNGWLGGGLVQNESGVRPVINLKADVSFSSGDGTASNPYIVAN